MVNQMCMDAPRHSSGDEIDKNKMNKLARFAYWRELQADKAEKVLKTMTWLNEI